MKYMIFLFLTVQIVVCQSTTGLHSDKDITKNNVLKVNVLHTENSVSRLISDLNFDGSYEELRGDRIIKISNNEYWVRNVTLTSSSGNVILFGNLLKRNDKSLMEQIEAKNGYIVLFEVATKNLEIYIADEFGSKYSDVVKLNY